MTEDNNMPPLEDPNLDGDLRARLVYVEHRIQDHKSRLVVLEGWANSINVANARREEQWSNMAVRLNNIDNNIKWVVRLIIGSIIAAMIAFIAGGGLNIPTN